MEKRIFNYFNYCLLLSVSVFLSCNRENHLADLDPCVQMEKMEFELVKTHKPDKNYLPGPINQSENYVVALGQRIEEPGYDWIVIDKNTNDVKTYLGGLNNEAAFTLYKDKIYFAKGDFGVNSMDVTSGAITPLTLQSNPDITFVSSLIMLEQNLYILGRTSGKVQVIKYNTENGFEENVITLDNLNGVSLNNILSAKIFAYKNRENIPCIVLVVEKNNNVVLYSFQEPSKKEEYFRTVEGSWNMNYVDVKNNYPFIEINNFPGKIIFNYKDNEIREYSMDEYLQGKYILSKSGTIRDAYTGSVIKTFNRPLVQDFKPLFFDPVINGLFCVHLGEFKLFDISTNCIQGKGLSGILHTYFDPERKTIYELYKPNSKNREIEIVTYK